MPLIPALDRQRQADLCEFEASLVYRVSSRKAPKATQRNPVSKKEEEEEEEGGGGGGKGCGGEGMKKERKKRFYVRLDVMANVFNPCIWRQRQADLGEF